MIIINILKSFLIFTILIFFLSCRKNNDLYSPPQLKGISSFSALVGDTLIITGLNFSTDNNSNKVKFGNKIGLVVNSKSYELKVIVPENVSKEIISVTVNGNSVYASDPFTSYNLYIAGAVNYDNIFPKATYWKNGVAVHLTDGSQNSEAKSIKVVGKDVYIAGMEGNTAKYWKNGIATNLTDGKNPCDVKDLLVLNGDVYVVGNEIINNKGNNIAKYWKNGISVPLSDGTHIAWANSISLHGSDIYIAGLDNNKATIWKNGKDISFNSKFNSEAFSVAAADSNIYVVGTEYIKDVSSLGTSWSLVGTYWKNGNPIHLTPDNCNGFCNSIQIVDNNIYFYIEGCEGTKYWKNGNETLIEDINFGGFISSMTVFNGKVFLLGPGGFSIRYSIDKKQVTFVHSGSVSYRAYSIVISPN